jgi:signal transduction histidine kinase/CheY-like chemotaxis protein
MIARSQMEQTPGSLTTPTTHSQTPGERTSLQSAKDLFGIFERSFVHMNVNQLMAELVNQLQQIATQCRVVVVVLSDSEAELHKIMVDTDNGIPINQKGLSLAATELFLQVGEYDKADWNTVGNLFDKDHNSVLMAGCRLTNKKHILFLLFSENNQKQWNVDELSLFLSCASSALNSMYLVKSLQRANDLLRESTTKVANLETLAALSDMTSGVAHDFNNIFGALIGRIELMKLRLSDQRSQNDLRNMEGMILEGAETVKRIQEFTTSARYKSVETVDLVPMVSEVLNNRTSSWYMLASQKDQQIVKDVSIDSAIVQGNSSDLQTALEKLLQNATEFSPSRATIRVSLTEDTSMYIIKVQDSGQGIAKDLQKKVFYPFFTTKGSRGAGLGLAIVHGVAVRHGGTVSVESLSGVGSVFTFTLPRAERTEDSSEQSKIIRESKSLRILVVDDDEQIRGVLCDMLEMDSHETVSCPDAVVALEAFAKGQFDLVITDLGMPGISGLELAERIHRENPSLPIAMITGWGTQLNKEEVALKGVRTVLSKPFHLKDIRALLEEVLHSRK